MASTRASVYRCYDAEGQLLYVGMSGGPKFRVEQGHRYESAWWADLAWWTETPKMPRVEALGVEYLAIPAEKPIHNRPARWAPKFMREAVS
jgi:hypothetical protein